MQHRRPFAWVSNNQLAASREALLHGHPVTIVRHRSTVLNASAKRDSDTAPVVDAGRSGSWFWLDEVPRVRTRDNGDRQRDSLLELAAVNERLAGTQAHEVGESSQSGVYVAVIQGMITSSAPAHPKYA